MTTWPAYAVVTHLWQSTLFVLVVWLVTTGLRQNRARVRCWLWVAASVKFLVPLSLLVGLGARFEWRTAPAIAQPAAAFVMDDVLAPPIVASVAANPVSPEAGIAQWVVAGLWLAGSLVVLLQWSRYWKPIRLALRAATPISLGPECDTRGFRVLVSSSSLEPGVCGVWRPVLLLPEGLLPHLTRPQLLALLAHERCHIRSRDNLAAAVHMAVEAIFWFHPFVWWIESRMIEERERACDEAVLQSGSLPVDYAEGILEVCRRSIASPLTCVSGVTGANLRRRIESIVQGEPGRPMSTAGRFVLPLAAVAVVGGPIAGGAVPRGQAAAAVTLPARTGDGLAFDAVSVRPNTSGEPRISAGTKGRTYAATNMPLRPIIAAAYGVGFEGSRLVGGPSWIGTGGPPFPAERFDIVGTLPENSTARDVPAMLRTLLATRFKLVVHTEVREAPAYALVLARSDGRLGPDLRAAAIDCVVAEAAGVTIPSPKAGERGPCDSQVGIDGGGLLARGQRLSSLARMMSQFVGRVIVDKTGLTGGFDFDLRFSEQATAAQPGTPADGVSLFTALQEQLGLKLEPAREQVEVVVIDSIEPPTPD
jgi:bla regulator protein BlaR1